MVVKVRDILVLPLTLFCLWQGAGPARAQGEGGSDSGPAQAAPFDATEGSAHIDYSAPDGGVPKDLGERVRMDQKIDAQLPLNLKFKDEDGHDVVLGQYFGKKPVLMNLIQLTCDQVCSAELQVMSDSLNQVPFSAGKDFTILTVSIDPRETPLIAKDAQDERLKVYTRPGAAAGWHFLTGSQASIKALTAAVGYKYIYQPETQQFIHPDGLIMLTPEGKVARYFLQLDYKPQDIRFSLMEASRGQLGSVIDQLALSCFHYDPAQGKYSFQIMQFIRLISLAFVAGALLTVGLWLLAEKKLPRKRGPVPRGPELKKA